MNEALLAEAIANYESGAVLTAEEETYILNMHIDPTNVLRLKVNGDYVEWVVWWQHPVTGRVYMEERRRTL